MLGRDITLPLRFSALYLIEVSCFVVVSAREQTADSAHTIKRTAKTVRTTLPELSTQWKLCQSVRLFRSCLEEDIHHLHVIISRVNAYMLATCRVEFHALTCPRVSPECRPQKHLSILSFCTSTITHHTMKDSSSISSCNTPIPLSGLFLAALPLFTSTCPSTLASASTFLKRQALTGVSRPLCSLTSSPLL